MPVRDGLQPGSSIARSELEQDVDYTLRVQVMPLNGTEADVVSKGLVFHVYPQTAELKNLNLTTNSINGNKLKDDYLRLDWSVDGEVDHFDLLITAPNGQEFIKKTLEANERTFSKTLNADGEYKVKLTAVPLYSIDNEGVQDKEISVTPRIPGFFEKYMVLLIVAAVIVLALAIGIPLLIRVLTPKMRGELTLECFDQDVNFNETFKFDNKSRCMYCNKPLTTHPDAAAHRGKEQAYTISGDQWKTNVPNVAKGMAMHHIQTTRLYISNIVSPPAANIPLMIIVLIALPIIYTAIITIMPVK